jgi:hypothetical protein
VNQAHPVGLIRYSIGNNPIEIFLSSGFPGIPGSKGAIGDAGSFISYSS